MARQIYLKLIQISGGGGFRLFHIQGRFGVDIDISEKRTGSHNHLIVGVHYQTDSAVFDRNAVKRLLKTNQISAECVFSD